jgi:hypothetical protein
MLVIALQFFTGDWWRAVKLARLLADVEARRRDDVCLLFVRTSEGPVTRLLDEVIARCSEVFHVQSLVIRPDTEARRARWDLLSAWPTGPNVLWAGAAEYFLTMSPRWSTIFFVDGGDGVPLHREWVDVAVGDHARTLRAGLSVTGAVFRDGLGRWHVNGNVFMERSFLEGHPEVLVMPECRRVTTGPVPREAWDVYHAPVVLPECRASSVVCCEWRRVGVRADLFPEAALHSAWWHGFKDGNFVDLARDYVLGADRPRPEVLDLGRATDLAARGSAC